MLPVTPSVIWSKTDTDRSNHCLMFEKSPDNTNINTGLLLLCDLLDWHSKLVIKVGMRAGMQYGIHTP